MSVNGMLLGFPNKGQLNSGDYFLPPEYSLPVPKNGARVQRRFVKRDVTTAMPITNKNPIIRWQIPNDGVKILDFRRATVYFTFSVSGGPGVVVRPSALAWNIIDRFRLEQAGQYVEDRRFFNFQETLSYRTGTHINQTITTGVALYGDGSAALRQTRSGGWKYALPIPSTALTKSIMPWFQVTKDGRSAAIPEVWLQWELASPSAFLELVSGVPTVDLLTYTITRVQVEYEELYGDGGNNFILRDWNPFPGMYPRIYYRSFMTNQYQLTTATEQSIPIEFKLSSIISIYVTFHFASDLNNVNTVNKFERYLGQNELPLTQFQFDVNGCLWPDQPVNLSDSSWVEAYLMYQRAFQMYHSRVIQQEVTPITISEFLNDRFVLVCDLNQHPLSTNILNPVSTRNSTQNILLKLTFSGQPSPGLVCLAHVFHWRAWNFGATGNVPLIEQ